jgi:hypothetical protein
MADTEDHAVCRQKPMLMIMDRWRDVDPARWWSVPRTPVPLLQRWRDRLLLVVEVGQ